MATISWIGGAAAIAQVQTYAFAGTWVIGETITITIGRKAYTYTIASATIATFLDALVVVYNALTSNAYPEFAEMTASRSVSNLILTADTAGRTFIATISTNSALGTIDAGASSTGTATTASSGPEDVSTAANWSGGVVPTTGDTVLIDREGARLKYGLAQSGVTLAVRRITANDVEIGLPVINSDGTEYPEYRQAYWLIGATADYVDTQSGRIKLDYSSIQTTYEQEDSGSGADANTPAVLLKGTHASNAFNIFGGEAGIAYYAGETSTAATLRADSGATVVCGYGVTLGTVKNQGAKMTLHSAIGTTLESLASKAVTTLHGTGAVAQLTATDGLIDYRTTGTLGGNTILSGSTKLDFDNDTQAKTVTNPIKVYTDNVVVQDTYLVCGTLTLEYHYCKPNATALGANVQLVRTAL